MDTTDHHAREDAVEPLRTSTGTPPDSPTTEQRPALERIATLFEQMHAHHKILLGIIAACTDEPLPREMARTIVEELKVGNASVYSAENYCTLLERAGAIELVNAAGQTPDESVDTPETVTVDGVTYLRPKASAALSWRATDAGVQALEEHQPSSRLQQLLSDKALYLPVFKRVLALCNRPGGVTTSTINQALDNDPLLQSPRFHASYFTEHLESCEAICWKNAWYTTDLGLEALDDLIDVEDEYGAQTIDGLYAITTTNEE